MPTVQKENSTGTYKTQEKSTILSKDGRQMKCPHCGKEVIPESVRILPTEEGGNIMLDFALEALGRKIHPNHYYLINKILVMSLQPCTPEETLKFIHLISGMKITDAVMSMWFNSFMATNQVSSRRYNAMYLAKAMQTCIDRVNEQKEGMLPQPKEIF